MPLTGFEGPAGTGKTHALIDAVRARLLAVPVLTHQRVLALTFMHGSRRRLTERFSQHMETRGKVDCMTVDSFAVNVLRRWHTLAGPTPEGFEAICDACGGLLENPQIAKWVSATYPIVVIDEAQELAPCRLRIVQALAAHTDMFAAADEFQCLNEAVDTAPFMAWFRTGNVTPLHRVRRTSRPGLLEAGISLRLGRSPAIGTGLAIGHTFPNQAPFSIGHVLARATGSTAVLVAPGARGWADAMIPRWVQGMQTPRQTLRPMPIAWEAGAALEAASVLTQICSGASATAVELERQILGLAEAPLWLPSALTAIRYAQRAQGRNVWAAEQLGKLLERKANLHNAFGRFVTRGIPVITIHGGKNRQFRNVFVLWGHGVVGTDDVKRRLLYNAITRAEHQCTVFLRAEGLRNAAPFA